jgi:CheY-like chemotaxis protein
MPSKPEKNELVVHSKTIDPSESARPQPSGKTGAKILYIEGDSALRDVMTQLVKLGTKYEIEVACHGLEGVEKARSWQPDLILAGLRMPVMDGFEAIRIIRNDPLTDHIPIIVISAWSTASYKKRALAAGANEHLTPPVDIHRLLKIIDRHLKL